jgi:hypothetical protein
MISLMSRRRTTKRFFNESAKRDSQPMPAAGEAAAPALDTRPATGPEVEPRAGVSAETLERMLAAEAAEREVSEQRTSDLVGRYFKLTLAMVCANMVVAGANVAMLFRRPAATHTVVTMPAPAPAAVAPPAPVVPTAPAVVVVPPPAQVAQPEPLLGSPAKAPLLGAPAKPALLGKATTPRRAPRVDKVPLLGKPAAEPSNSASEPARAVASPSRGGSVLTARLADERSDPPIAERW